MVICLMHESAMDICLMQGSMMDICLMQGNGLMTCRQKKRPLTWEWVALGVVVCWGLDVPIEGEELFWVVLYPGLTYEFVTYQPEHPWVGFHLGNLLCHGEWDLDLREGLIGGLDCLLESLCLG